MDFSSLQASLWQLPFLPKLSQLPAEDPTDAIHERRTSSCPPYVLNLIVWVSY